MARGCCRCDFSHNDFNKCFCQYFSKEVSNRFRCDKFIPKGFREDQKQKYINSIIENENRRKAYFGIDEWEETEEEIRYWNNWK